MRPKSIGAWPVVAAVMVFVSAASLGSTDTAQAPQPPRDPAPAQDTGRRRVALPEEDPNFVTLLDSLAQRAALYRKFALGFSCRENVTTAKYDIDSGGFRKSDKTAYDYLFEESPGGGLREVREEVVSGVRGGEKTKGTDFESQAPPTYAWSTLFSKENRGRFHFRPAGQVVKAYRLLILIDFIGTSPNPGGTDIAGWSGQVALESRSLNLWSVEAAPSGQDVRLEVEILRYRKAFAIAGVPLAARPHGWKLNVTFGMDVKGLSYPTEQVLSMTSLARDGRMSVERKNTFRYEDYRFFEIESTEKPVDSGP
jgi:hypothetical protein